ncbi:unnamed protein product [Urochloa decumbens]|uniref:folate gamma-glutamyl hydrolase n=1 Tax=Urochloa decumbens TaxID=240449 RepID=A0ABC8VP37_9POAL
MAGSPRMFLVALILVVLAAIMAPSSATRGLIRLPLDDDHMCGDRPVIGILTHPGSGTKKHVEGATSHIGASYVKLVESAGARVIPLLYDDPREDFYQNLKLVNGVIFTGGSETDPGQYSDRIFDTLQYVMDRKEDGDPIPLLAICLGFQIVSTIVAQDKYILTKFDATNQPSTLQFPVHSLIKGSVFDSFEQEFIDKLKKNPLAMQNHQYGISPDKWERKKQLTKFFNVLTTSVDREDKEYVSTVQAKDYPIIGTQWHPEKVFEWGQAVSLEHDKAPHSEDAVRLSEHFAKYFISQARKSANRTSDCKDREDKVRPKLVDNYLSKFGQSNYFDKVYIFPNLQEA